MIVLLPLQTDNCVKEGKNQFMGLVEAYLVASSRKLVCKCFPDLVCLAVSGDKYPPGFCTHMSLRAEILGSQAFPVLVSPTNGAQACVCCTPAL